MYFCHSAVPVVHHLRRHLSYVSTYSLAPHNRAILFVKKENWYAKLIAKESQKTCATGALFAFFPGFRIWLDALYTNQNSFSCIKNWYHYSVWYIYIAHVVLLIVHLRLAVDIRWRLRVRAVAIPAAVFHQKTYVQNWNATLNFFMP